MKLFILFFINTFIAIPKISANNLPLNTREIILPNFQHKEIKKDFPINDIHLETSQILWIAGNKFVWRWNIMQNTLKKIPIPIAESGKIKKIEFANNRLYAISEKELLQITFEPIKITKLSIKERDESSFDFKIKNEKLYWITNRSIYQVNHIDKKFEKLPYIFNLEDGDKVDFFPEDHRIWQIKKNVVLLHNELGTQQSKTIYKTKNEIRNISFDNQSIFVATKYTVLHFHISGDLVQTIPVENNRKLVLMEHHQNHLYLFSDKILEIYDIKNKKNSSYILDLGQVKKASHLTSNNSTIALILDGSPRVFQIPKEIKQ